MKALSIRQPWAWLIIYGGKDIENRDWFTPLRGRFLVHAAKGMTANEYEKAMRFATRLGVHVPPATDLQRGGIIGTAGIVDCVKTSASPWFFGRYGFALTEAQPLPFIPWKGSLGFFNVPDAVVAK